MTKRGKILRTADPGPGLLMVDGQQYRFSAQELWKSEGPPRFGMVAEVEFAPDGNIRAIYEVDESQLARERIAAAVTASKQQRVSIPSSLPWLVPTVIAASLLVVSWVSLSAVSLQTPVGSLDLTFWQTLGLLNTSKVPEKLMQIGQDLPSAGMYGLLAILAMSGPFLRHFWKDKRSALGGLLPLLFMAAVAWMFRSGLKSGIESDPGGALALAMKQVRDKATAGLSVGFGTYLSGMACLYFAAIAAKQFWPTGVIKTQQSESARRAAA